MPKRAPSLVLAVLLASALPSCGGGGASALGECATGQDCPSGLCIGGRCADPDGDPDHDGLSTADETRLRLDPLDPDSDGDGLPDGTEVGEDPANPRDGDGDGRIDARESSTGDADQDCLPDPWDPRDQVPDATPAEVAARACSARGVCGAHPGAVRAACGGGAVACDYSAVPGWRAPAPGCGDAATCDEDRCDGADNDCDGRTDEGFVRAGVPLGKPCTLPGRCGAGVVECAADPSATRCSSGPGGSADRSLPESCNGEDDDCDGVADQGLAWEGVPLGQACDGPGECGAGVVECRPDGTPGCSTAPGGSADASVAETCNGADDDCNGQVDDGAVPGDPDVVCPPKGICASWPGRVRVTCEDGRMACDFSAVPGWSGAEEARCDGRDDDCDGLMDEAFGWVDPVAGWRAVGQSCGPGACAGGVVACGADGTSATCTSLGLAGPEECNDRDDDCDGRVDEGLPRAWDGQAGEADAGDPAPRAAAALAFLGDSAGDLAGLWIYGGAGTLGADDRVRDARDDLWRYDPRSRRFQGLGPGLAGPRAGGRLVHDPDRGRLWLVGGRLDPDPVPLWAYDLSTGTWSEAGPPAVQDGVLAAAVEPGTGDLLWLRMDDGTGEALLARLSVGDDPGIRQQVLALPWRRHGAAAADPVAGRFYLLGGVGTSGEPVGDAWGVSFQGTARPLAGDGTLPSPSRHALAVLEDGRLLVAGGLGSDGKAAREAWILSPASAGGDWRAAPVSGPPVGALEWPALCTVPGGALLASGRLSDGSGLRQVLRFDAEGSRWTTELLTPRPPAREGAVLAVLPRQRLALALGGTVSDLSGGRAASDLWRLSLDDLSWGALAPSGASLAFLEGAQAVDAEAGVLYLHGGRPADGPEAQADRLLRVTLDPPVVEDLGPGPGPRRGHAMAWTGAGLVLVGGLRDGVPLADAWTWDPLAGWSRLPLDGEPRAGHAAAWDEATGRVLLAGGTADGAVHALDPATGALELLARDGRLAAVAESSAWDPDSRSLLLGFGPERLPAVVEAGPPLAVRALPAGALPPLRASAGAYDPLLRRALFFGGVRPGIDTPAGAPASALWILSQSCPASDDFLR